VKERRSKVKLVGFDWSPTLLDDLNAGVVDSLVVQNPFEMGYQSVKAAVAKFNGQPVEKIQNLAPKLIDRENLHSPDVEAQLHPDLKKYLQ
jgi:ribose transport system substrate-binding protein